MTVHPDQAQFPGTEAETKVAIFGARFKTDVTFELGEKVTLVVHGHVTLTGREILENEGERGVAEIRADVIEVQGSAP